MEIQVRLYGILQQYRPPGVPEVGAFALEVPEGATVAGVAEQLRVPKSWAHNVFVNGEPGKATRVLSPGDQVVFLPPARGGIET